MTHVSRGYLTKRKTAYAKPLAAFGAATPGNDSREALEGYDQWREERAA
ncbi:hypothetical protein GCM10011533_36210 [Streptosporangium jomthongense]|nr:hypothetical protein GCM10011533_36210 [Streptosporangium jomthongense]